MTSDDERPPKQRRLSNGEKFDSSTAKDEVNVEELSHKVPTGDSRSEEATKPSPTASPEQTKSDTNAKDVTPPVAPSETQSTQAPTAGQTETEKPLSKNQQRKLRKKAEWEAGREERKVVRKEKTAARRERKKEAKREAASSGTQVAQQSQDRGGKRHRSLRPVQLPVTFVIDCDFDNLMTDNERVSLASQVTRCYSDNKNAHFRAHLTISSFGGHLKERYDGLLAGVHKSWRGTRFLQCNFVETAEKAKEWMSEIDGGGMLKGAFEPLADSAKEDEGRKLKEQGEIVYLTSEADEELEELKPYSTYIIGGLVDKNREKGICYRRAVEAGVKTARLPIGKYLEMQSRKVLTTNHVHEIMVKWLECRDWGEAFMKVIPKRKGGKLKGEEEEGNEDDNDPEVGAEKKSDEAPKAEAEIVNVAPMNGDSQAESEFEAEADTSEEMPTSPGKA